MGHLGQVLLRVKHETRKRTVALSNPEVRRGGDLCVAVGSGKNERREMELTRDR